MTVTIVEEASETNVVSAAQPATELLSAADDVAVSEAQLQRFDGAIDPSRVRLFRGPRGVLRCTVEGERTVLRAKVVRAFPLSHRSRWVNVLDWKNKEVCLIEDPDALDAESRRLVDEELGTHYRHSTILRIRSLLIEYRTMYWDVDTDRGRREFAMKWAADTILWLGEKHLMLVDIDTNRFVIPDVSRLDAASLKHLKTLM